MKSKKKLFITKNMWRLKPRIRKLSSVNPLYFIINKMNCYSEESNGCKYLTLASTDESKVGITMEQK